MSAPVPAERPPAMTDVAAVAGVSHQTVSRVINNVGKVRPETRERVLLAIQQLGYRRNEAARALATSRSSVIGMITTTDDNFGPASTMFAVQLAARQAGYFVNVASLEDFSEQSLSDAVDALLRVGAQGIIVIAPIKEVAARLGGIRLDVPVVAISSAWSEGVAPIVHVGCDQRAGGIAAVQHLIAAGCRRIAHVAGPSNWFDAIEREEGWRAALADAGLAPDRLLQGDWTAASGYRQMNLLLREDLPDAVFFGNDQMALGALHALSEAQISVPGQLRLVGFDDEPGSAYFSPGLTTVRQNFDALGQGAVDAITQLISGEAASSELIAPSLVVRATA